jgi:hypothetical protein
MRLPSAKNFQEALEPDQFDLDDEAFETFVALKREGIIGAFGLAYARSISEMPDFGTVIESQYRNEQPPQADDKTRIFHGVLRHGWRNDPHSKTEDASKVNSNIGNVFNNPNVGIIFSASSAHQIGQVTADVRRIFRLLAAMPPASFVDPLRSYSARWPLWREIRTLA